MKTLKMISDILHTITSVIVSILLTVLTVVSVTGVIFRFVFNNPIVWLFEFSIVSFSWIIFMGVAMAFKTQEHMSLTFLMNSLKPKGKYILTQLINLASLIFMVIAMVKGFEVVSGTINQYYNTIPVSKGVFYLSMPLGSIAAISHIILNMFSLRVDSFKAIGNEQ